jgi:hypothetical protein
VNIATENILKQITVRIKCNDEVGSGVLYFPKNNPAFVYVFTAKHCLCGKEFSKIFKTTDIIIDKIFKQSTGFFSEYRCLDRDEVIQTDNEDDVAVIVLKKAAIVEIIGDSLEYKLVEKNDDKYPVHFRGFPQLTRNETDRPIETKFVEEIKSHTQKFQLTPLSRLDSFYTPSAENMAGTSGSGLFIIRENVPYLLGILTDIDKIDDFFGTKISVLNEWFIKSHLPALNFDSFQEVALRTSVDVYIKETVEKMVRDFLPAEQFDKTIEDIDLSTGVTFPELKTFSKRAEVVQICQDYLTSKCCLWMQGDVGIGKTHLSYLTASTFSDRFWLDLSDFDANSSFQYLLATMCSAFNLAAPTDITKATDLIHQHLPERSIIVLNDMPDLTGQARIQSALSSFILNGVPKGIKVIVTSNYAPGMSIQEIFDQELIEYTIPMFDDKECKEVLLAYGATEDIDQLSGVIVELTDGHPLIINAVCRYLREQSWTIDIATLDSLFKNEYGKQLDKETYEKLLTSTEDEDSRQLLFRSKIIIGTFKEREIQVVGNVEPAIENLNQKIIRLSGLWLKPLQNDKFQLSALVKRLGQNLGQTLSETINKALGDDIIDQSPLSPANAFKALRYFDRAKSYNQAAFLLIKVLNSSLDNPKLFFNWGFSLFWYYDALPVSMHPFAKLYIRFMQINLSLMENKETSFLINDLNEIAKNKDIGDAGKGIVSLLNFRLNLDKNPVGSMESYINAITQLSPIIDEAETTGMSEITKLKDVIWLTFYNLKTKQEYEAWFVSFRKSGIDPASINIEQNQGYMLAGVALHRNILAPTPLEKWPEMEDTLLFILTQALDQKLYLIAVYAIRNLIQLIFCTSKNVSKILHIKQEYGAFIEIAPIYKFLVYDELGRQYKYAEQKENALIELSKVADEPIPEIFTEKPGFLIAYSELISIKSEELAHKYILEALRLVLNKEYYTPLEQMKLYGEVGLSYFLIGKPYDAMKSLEKSFDMLLSEYDNSDDFKATIIRNGHNVNYISKVIMDGVPPTKTSNDDFYAPPTRGSFFYNNEKLLKGGFYFEQRRYINCIIYQATNEFYGDYEASKKWALKSIEIALNLNSGEFASLLYRNLFYLVKDREYLKAIDLYNKIKDAYVTNDDELLKGNGSLPQRPPGLVDYTKNDFSFFEEVMIPIVIQIAQDIIDGVIAPDGYEQMISEVFDNGAIRVTDTETLFFFKTLFDQILLCNITRNEFQALISSYQGRNLDQVMMVGYIMYSLNSNAAEAAELQLALMERIEKFHSKNFVGLYKFMIIPFLEDFWIKKFDTHKREFSDNAFWLDRSVPSFKNVPASEKLRKIFRTLRHHLPLKTTTNHDNWIDS